MKTATHVSPGTSSQRGKPPGRMPHQPRAEDRGHDPAGAGSIDVRRAKKWWRWGRVELPVQKPSPETTTSVFDDLSSIARSTIDSLPGAPVTSPFGL